jgi:hypothetical protein
MAKFIGRQQEVGIGRESSRGVIVAPTIWAPKTNFSLDDKVVKARMQGSYGNILGGDDALVSERYAQGDLEMEAQDNALALLLYSLFGTLTTASFNSAYKHTLAIANSVQHQSLSFHMNDPIGAAASPNAVTVAYARAMVDQLEITSKQGEAVMAKFSFLSMVHKDWQRQTPSYVSQNKFTSKHTSVKVAANLAGLDAASKISVQELTLTIKKNVIRENSLGTVQPVDILNRKIEISGKLKLTYEDRTYRDYMVNGTKKAMRISILNGDVTIGTTNPQLQLDLSVVDFDQWAPASDLEDLSTQEITFTALYDVSNNLLIGTSSFVVNSTTSY